jgi:hypothetical protein
MTTRAKHSEIQGQPHLGVSTVQPRQAQALAALNIKKPTIDAQLPLL